MSVTNRLSVGALVVAVSICAGQTTHGVELLTGGDFEFAGAIPDWDLEESVFDQTTMMRRDFGSIDSAEQITFDPQSGTHDLWLRAFVGGMVPDADALSNATLSQTVPATAGQSYTFTGYSRYEANYAFEGTTLDATGPLGAVASPTKNTFLLEFLDSGGAVIGSATTLDVTADRVSQSILPNLDDWLQHTLGATAPAGTVSARVTADAEAMLWNGGSSESAFYDTFSLTDDSDPSTELLSNENLDDLPGFFDPAFTVVEDPGGNFGGAAGPTIESAGFANNPATGGTIGAWLRSFEGSAADTAGATISQTVAGSEGEEYTFTLSSLFQPNYSGGTGTFGTTTTAELAFLDSGGSVIGTPETLDLKTDRESQSGGSANDAVWYDHTLTDTAPTGTASVRVQVAALDMETNPIGGQQSAFLDDFSLMVTSAPGIPGDFDGDGDVDTDDFGVFVNSFQLSPQGGPPFAPGDFDEDGDVDTDDFGVFVNSFQNFPPPAVAVPEPTAGLLAAFGLAAALLRRRQRG